MKNTFRKGTKLGTVALLILAVSTITSASAVLLVYWQSQQVQRGVTIKGADALVVANLHEDFDDQIPATEFSEYDAMMVTIEDSNLAGRNLELRLTVTIPQELADAGVTVTATYAWTCLWTDDNSVERYTYFALPSSTPTGTPYDNLIETDPVDTSAFNSIPTNGNPLALGTYWETGADYGAVPSTIGNPDLQASRDFEDCQGITVFFDVQGEELAVGENWGTEYFITAEFEITEEV